MMKAFAILSLFALEAGAKKTRSSIFSGLIKAGAKKTGSSILSGVIKGAARRVINKPNGGGKPNGSGKPNGGGKPNGSGKPTIERPTAIPTRDPPKMTTPSDDAKLQNQNSGDAIYLPPDQIKKGKMINRLKKFVLKNGKELLRDTITGVLVNQINNALSGTATTLAPGETTLAPTDPGNCDSGCEDNQRCHYGQCVAKPPCATPAAQGEIGEECAPHGYCSSKGYCRFKKQDGKYCHGIDDKCLPGSICKNNGALYKSTCEKDPAGGWTPTLNCQDNGDCLLTDCNVFQKCKESDSEDGHKKCTEHWGNWGRTVCPLMCGFCQAE